MPCSHEDVLEFAEEGDDERVPTAHAWRILIVDDDVSVHDATKIALGHKIIEGRKLRLDSAYSGKEALQIILNRKDEPLPDLVLMDVVMDTPQDGIDTVHALRRALEQNDIPYVIIRSGQIGGNMGFEELRNDRDIDLVVEKARLTASLLFEHVSTGLKASQFRGQRQAKD